MDQETRSVLKLAVTDGVGPQTVRQLIAHFGTAAAAIRASDVELMAISGIGPDRCRLIKAAEQVDEEQIQSRCAELGAHITFHGDESYPDALGRIYDPPSVLFHRGNFCATDTLAIAIVGTRRASQYGLNQARRLASALSEAGFVIVSGLARGIDAAAHRATVRVGGRTIAVLASGVADIYPPEHAALAEEILSRGMLVSEAPPDRSPRPGAFPRRNRIITGLSLGVIVVEAAERSGAMISARLAMEQDREVFAVPGNADSRNSRGCHQLLRDGATLVESAADVLDQLGPLAKELTREDGRTLRHPQELTLNEQEQAILAQIQTVPTLVDRVVESSGVPVQRVLATITALERRHLIKRVSGALVIRF